MRIYKARPREQRSVRRIAALLLALSLLASPAFTQSSERTPANDADLAAAQRRDFVISTVISLAKETNSFSDLALRPRVLARAADVLWDADNVNARAIFIRAWEAAEKGDAQEVTIKTKDNPPPMVMSLRRLSGYDLRSEVLGFIARRDRKLAEAFLAKLTSETEQQANDSRSTRPLDNWSASETDTKRLEVARLLLRQGLEQDALEIAWPALFYVNAKSITFLSELRTRNAAKADQKFSNLLISTAFDPSADANTISGLSSYAFTPSVYITFKADGGATWTQTELPISSPELPANLRDKFLQIAANLLLRQLPPSDQDSSSSGRIGTINVIKRLLPFFEQYVPDTAATLRGHLIQLAGNSSKDTRSNDNHLLTQGIREDEPGEVLKGLQERIDRAKTSRQRDLIYATTAVTLAMCGMQARDLADKIDDAELKAQVQQFVDFQFVQLAIKKKDPSKAIRLAETGLLTHTQRAFGYTQAARLLTDSQPQQSLELLEMAMDETMRTENGTVDRAVLLVGIATQLTAIDRSRGWEIMNRAVEAANASQDFNGENWIYLSMPSTSGIKSLGIGGKEFSLSGVFQLLAKDDLYRAIDLMKSFKHDAARAAATLAIANAILTKQGG
jgi:hypothetical protein